MDALRALGCEKRPIVITGATGTGKTYLACAFAEQACRKGHRVLYRRVPRLRERIVGMNGLSVSTLR